MSLNKEDEADQWHDLIHLQVQDRRGDSLVAGIEFREREGRLEFFIDEDAEAAIPVFVREAHIGVGIGKNIGAVVEKSCCYPNSVERPWRG